MSYPSVIVDENTHNVTISSPENMSLAGCISLFGGVGILKVGIRNNCPNCMSAVMSWSDGTQRKYAVQGNSQIVIDTPALNGQLIGEEPC